ncbi:MAG: hypothetical protein R3343_09900 [Nitriliruptorales bacterium]|nr:hypothetical protein [Nitriliruptorales bacterium]
MHATASAAGLRARLVRVFGLGGVALLALTSCLAPPDRERIELGGDLYGASVNGSILSIEVPTCNGEPEVTKLEETNDEVRVEVVSQRQRGGDDCLDGVQVELDRPLGDRALIDVTSGRAIRGDEP